MTRKKQQGGYLKGPSHKEGGMAAIIDGQEPVELEGGEYIIKKSSVKKLGKKTLDQINKKGRIPDMAKGGKLETKVKATDKQKTSNLFQGSAKDVKDRMKRNPSFAKGMKKYYGVEVKDFKNKSKKKKQMGGQVAGGYKPTADMSARPPFRQGIRMMEHGGEVSVSNDNASAGDVHTTHSHSGYKAGE